MRKNNKTDNGNDDKRKKKWLMPVIIGGAVVVIALGVLSATGTFGRAVKAFSKTAQAETTEAAVTETTNETETTAKKDTKKTASDSAKKTETTKATEATKATTAAKETGTPTQTSGTGSQDAADNTMTAYEAPSDTYVSEETWAYVPEETRAYVPEEPQTTQHEHEWTWHDETGHWEERVVSEAWDERVQTGTQTVVDQEAWDEEKDNGGYETHYWCNCKAWGTDYEAMLAHQDETLRLYGYYSGVNEDGSMIPNPNADISKICMHWWSSYEWFPNIEIIHHDAITHEEPVYTTVHHDAVTDNVWIVDTAGYYSCYCGATR